MILQTLYLPVIDTKAISEYDNVIFRYMNVPDSKMLYVT